MKSYIKDKRHPCGMEAFDRNSLQWRQQADRLREEYRAETDAEKKAEAGVRLLECLYCFEEMHKRENGGKYHE